LFYWGGFRGFSKQLRFIKGLCQNCPDVSHLCDVWSYWIPLLYIYVLMDVVRTTHKFLAIIWQCVYHWCKWWTNEWNIWSVILAWNWTLLWVLQKCGLNCFGFIYLFIWEIPYRTERGLQILKSCYDGKHLCTYVVISSKSKISSVYIFISFVAYTFTCYIFPQQIFMLHSIFKCYEHE